VKAERSHVAVKPERLPFNYRARQQVKFDGRIVALKGYIYDCADSRQTDQYVKTTREIAGYVATALRNGNDVRTAIETLVIPKMKLPSDLPANASAAQKRHWEKRIDEISKKELLLEENMKTLFSIVWGQVSDTLKHRIQALADYKRMNSEGDSLALLAALRDQAFNFQSQKDQAQALHEAVRRFYLINQGKTDSCQAYMDRYENGVQVIKHIGGKLPVYDSLVDADLKTRGLERDSATAAEVEKSEETARERQLAMGYILGCDRVRYGKLIEDLENQHTQGIKSFPQTLSEAYTLANNWKNGTGAVQKHGVSEGVVFTNTTKLPTNKKKKNKDHITCFKCGIAGHYSNECTTVTSYDATEADAGKQFLNMSEHMDEDEDSEDSEFLFYTSPCKNPSDVVSRNWVLLDNQSTVDVFQNKELLTNVRDSGRVLNIHCNAGVASTSLMGYLPGYGEVWLYEGGIANILSLSRVKKRYRVTYDSENGNKFVVHLNNGLKQTFSQSKAGLYYSVARAARNNEIKTKQPLLTTNKSVKHHTTLNTVAENKAKYTNREVLQATLARKIQKSIGHPSLKRFIEIVENNYLTNCPIVKQDILRAEDIFGPELGCLKGKTVRSASIPVKIVPAPVQLTAVQKRVVLAIDIMYINDIPFFITISRDLHFGSAQAMGSETYKSIYGALEKIIKIYRHYGFSVTHILGDGQFEFLDPSKIAPGITLNIVTRGEHVPEVERYIRTVKERTRSVYNSLPFKRFPTKLIVEIVYAQIFWLNSFPSDSGLSRTQSPRVLMTGTGIDYNLHCRLECGSYVQTHEEHGNNMAPRTIGALALRPTGNVQGGFYFYNLATGCIISRRRWTSLPMPVEIINVVHEWAEKDKASKGIDYGDGTPTPDDGELIAEPAGLSEPIVESVVAGGGDVGFEAEPEDDGHNSESELSGVMDVGDSGEIPGVDAAIGDDGETTGVRASADDDSDVIMDGSTGEELPVLEDEAVAADSVGGSSASDLANVLENSTAEGAHTDGSTGEDVTEHSESFPDEPVEDMSATRTQDIAASMDERYGSRSGQYNLRPRRERNLDRWNDTVLTCHGTNDHPVGGVIHTQHYVHQGLKLFGKDGEDAITAELKQLHQRQVLEPLHCHALTDRQKDDALPYLMFLKKKHTGQIKGRGCADGRRQRIYMQKEDTSSPTVSIESLFISATLDALEKREVVTVDIPGAFMQADMVGTVHMKLEGKIADLLCELEPEMYSKYIQKVKGKSIMYVRLRKALYGTLQAALLFWQDLTKTLTDWGFIVNPYDRCVANKTVNGSQCTVLWHVDDLKISHKDKDVVNEVLDYLSKRYGKEAPLTVNRGKTHRYLGMMLDYSMSGKVQINMSDYIDEMLKSLPEDMSGESSTPAGNHLFTVNPVAVALSSSESDMFHHYVAKLLFLCKRARPDLQTAVAFLSTRVRAPDQDDLKKLGRAMRYLRFTRHLPLTLEADDDGGVSPRWWVDASFATHSDMKSHTGGIMSMGKGAICAWSKRQRINTKSSTEAELVGVNDMLPQVLWVRYFLEAQGYSMLSPTKIYQDNMSAIQLEKNGKASSGQRTRHINIRYFFVADRVSKKEVEMTYCPTGDMTADLLTKPLQGSLFKRFRDTILNVQEVASRPPKLGVSMMHRSVLRNETKEADSQVQEPHGHRSVKIKDLHVSWKWPVGEVYHYNSYVRKTVRKTPQVKQRVQPQVYPCRNQYRRYKKILRSRTQNARS